ncbi:MAG: hypothetical protein KAY24_04320 [Candidatus Eisenbacteria sp.]|nr:hypothetical protein [Candidatus Eisenbacteria bacterium]
MRRHPNVWIVLLGTVLIGCPLLLGGCEGIREAPPVAPPDEATTTAFQAAMNAGYASLDAGNLDGALEQFRKLEEVVPQSPYAAYHMACAYGRSARAKEAVKAMRLAVAKGYSDRERAQEDPDLESLHSDSAWDNLLAQMDENLTAQSQLLEGSLLVPDPSTEPSFPSLDSLQTLPCADLIAMVVSLRQAGARAARR